MFFYRHLEQRRDLLGKALHILSESIVTVLLCPTRALVKRSSVVVGVTPPDRQHSTGTDIRLEHGSIAFMASLERPDQGTAGRRKLFGHDRHLESAGPP